MKAKLQALENKLEVEELLGIVGLLDSDPMLDCLTALDRRCWQSLNKLFEEQEIEDKRAKFMNISQSLVEDPIMKGK